MDARELKGLELAARADIRWERTHWAVPSMSGSETHYVAHDLSRCSCDDFDLRGKPCKHMIAARHVRDRNRGKPLPPMVTDDERPTPRATYKQAWPAYNAAQTREKELFLRLLSDLCRTVPYVPREGRGRPRIPLGDAVFAAAFKVYSTVSGRRFTTDLRAAQASGFVGTAPHYNSVFRVLEDADVTLVLKRLVIQSSLPLRAVETDFAIDSSGFGTSRFARWFDQKYGVERKRAEWVKCHLMVGVRTNVVTAVDVRDSHDGQLLPSLVATTAQNFTVSEVAADKAYLSHENLDFVAEFGGTPFVPFKAGSRGDTGGEVWAKMFHYFSLHRDEFLAHYHKRSNVESAFSMMKRKFGDSIRSKTDVAMVNEVLCHNVVVLIHEMHELGIDPTFGQRAEPDGDGARVLRFPGA